MFHVSAQTTLSVKIYHSSSLSKTNPQKLEVLCLMTEAEEEENNPAFWGQCFHSSEGWEMPSAISVVIFDFVTKYMKYLQRDLVVNNKNIQCTI
jgi:hypothetical protein